MYEEVHEEDVGDAMAAQPFKDIIIFLSLPGLGQPWAKKREPLSNVARLNSHLGSNLIL